MDVVDLMDEVDSTFSIVSVPGVAELSTGTCESGSDVLEPVILARMGLNTLLAQTNRLES